MPDELLEKPSRLRDFRSLVAAIGVIDPASAARALDLASGRRKPAGFVPRLRAFIRQTS